MVSRFIGYGFLDVRPDPLLNAPSIWIFRFSLDNSDYRKVIDMPFPKYPPVITPAPILRWTLTGPKKEEYIESAHKAKYDEWVKNIVGGMHPKVAAEKIGDSHYEVIDPTLKIFTIRISQKHRVAFKLDEVKCIVNVFQLGGHYPAPKK
jgi:hypothetical protein